MIGHYSDDEVIQFDEEDYYDPKLQLELLKLLPDYPNPDPDFKWPPPNGVIRNEAISKNVNTFLLLSLIPFYQM